MPRSWVVLTDVSDSDYNESAWISILLLKDILFDGKMQCNEIVEGNVCIEIPSGSFNQLVDSIPRACARASSALDRGLARARGLTCR